MVSKLLGELAAYLLTKTPSLSRSELAKLVFLTDYNYCKKTGNIYSGISWFYDSYGPFTTDTEDSLLNYGYAIKINDKNKHGNSTTRYKLLIPVNDLPSEIQYIVDSLLSIHRNMSYRQFIEFVYNTYPVKKSIKKQSIDLVSLVNQELDAEVDTVWTNVTENYNDVMVALAK